jgi:hypothetical protein
MWLPVCLQAQDHLFLENDSIEISGGLLTFSDSIIAQTDTAVQIVREREAFKPNPKKAVIYSAIFPGLGQIYNRKYWKLPIVYGGFLGCTYAITWNATQYKGYKNAYKEFTDDRPETNSWRSYNYKTYGGTEEEPETWNASAVTGFSSRLKSGKDFYRRNMELSYIITVGLYALCMIDAYVDAQLFEFDISENLSFRVDPVIFDKTATHSKSFGLQCSLTF